MLGLQLYNKRHLFALTFVNVKLFRLHHSRRLLESIWEPTEQNSLFFPCTGLLQEHWVDRWRAEETYLKRQCGKRRQLKERHFSLNHSHPAVLFLGPSVSFASYTLSCQICLPCKTPPALEWRCQQLQDPWGYDYLISCLSAMFKHMPYWKGRFSSMTLGYT